MNDPTPDHFTDPRDEHADTPDVLAPLDDFEQQWVSQLREPAHQEPGDTDAFVQAVLDRHAAAHTAPSIAGRIGLTPAYFAAAAALLIAAIVGWNVLGIDKNDTPGEPIIARQQPTPEKLQPLPDEPVVPNQPSNIRLGQLIGQTQSRLTQPASNLSAAISQTPGTLRIDRFIDFVTSPVPDLKELLEQTEEDQQQSRA